MPVLIHHNQAVRPVQQVYAQHEGTLRHIREIWVKAGGEFRRVYLRPPDTP